MRRVAPLAIALSLGVGLAAQRNFLPDATFNESTLSGWTAIGDAEWRVEDGIILGRAVGDAGGWLMHTESWQDVQLAGAYRCTGACAAGVLVRAEKTDRGWKGVYVALADATSAAGAFAIEIDARGREVARTPLTPGGGQVRVMPPPPAGGYTTPPNLGIAAPPAVPPGSPYERRDFSFRPGTWNDFEVVIDANILRAWVNDGPGTGAANGRAGDELGRYGPIALHVGRGDDVAFRQLAWKDLGRRVLRADRVSARFRMRRLNDFYYGWSAAAGDINRDGVPDVVAGPFYYLGPDFETSREFALIPPANPGAQYGSAMVNFVSDFTADGWPDVLVAESRPLVLYVNPRGARRRWDRHVVVADAISEINVFKDVDGDGRADVVFTGKAGVGWASPDPADPTAPWVVRTVSTSDFALGAAHGLGAGDVNGDGRVDIVSAHGWWEQPAAGRPSGLWPYHPARFGRWPRMSSSPGGGEMGVYDVNGDGLADIVTSLEAHAWGLAWFEQRRDRSGAISFVEHMISDAFTAANAGDVTFSQPHGTAFADIDGDGLLDFVVGKRAYSHSESYYDPDPYGDAAIYWYRTVRNPSLAGGAVFVPELIHNRSGAGSTIGVADLDGDGTVDVFTSTTRGTFVFLNSRSTGR